MAESSTRHIKKAIVIGAGRTGTALAPMLEADGISVKSLILIRSSAGIFLPN